MKKIDEVSPPGWGGTTSAMKKHHPEIKNPWALAWSMKNKGYKAHYKQDDEGTKSKKEPTKKAKYRKFKEWLIMREGNLEIPDPRTFKQVRYTYPDINEELGEIRDRASQLGMQTEDLSNRVQQAIQQRRLGPLNGNWADTLDNFEGGMQTLEQVITYLESKPRDWRRIVQAYQTGGTLPAPIVLVRQGAQPFLIAGNSRLMFASVLKQTPQVLWVQ